MAVCEARWLRRAVLAVSGVVLALACSTPEYDFIEVDAPEHCANELADTDLGETDIDCGGPDCRGCGLGQACALPGDCVEGECLDGFCQVPGCDNALLDEGETDVDCGGSCKGCQADQGCVSGSDCESGVCTVDRCSAPGCADGVINGGETGRDCGGGLCNGCPAGSPCVAPADCGSGVCESRRCEVSCVEGTDECDADPSEECETNLLTSAENCGACGEACALANTMQRCVGGQCQVGGCEALHDDCNNEPDDGCETNLAADVANCSVCGSACSDDNGTPSCASGACEIECDAGFADCNDDRADGCERSVATDVSNCGECERDCPFGNGETPFCVDGLCGASVCADGLGNCDGSGEDCEQDLTSDAAHCGRCGGVCTVAHGTPRCNARACSVESCDAGWENCDRAASGGGYANGCETNTDVDEQNCGACGNACATVHGTASCVDGECRVMGCDAGWANCDVAGSGGGYPNGCETNIATDKANCGGCGSMGRNCDADFAPVNATGQCVNSRCQVDDCFANFGDCDGTPGNGCESDLRSDEGDCGMCARACVPTGTTGTPGNECVSGSCNPTCDANHLNCNTLGPDGCEVDRRTDEGNCGTCGTVCQQVFSTNNCMAGACVPACDAAHRSCDGDPNDGCETGITGTGNEAHCGGCASSTTACTASGATATTCNASGACAPTCDATHLSCDGNGANGCELTQSNTNCGSCGRACQSGGSTHAASNACNPGGASSSCQPVCDTGWGACANPTNSPTGCPTQLNASPNCGACGASCSGATPSCVSSGAAARCQAEITTANDVDGSVAASSLNLTHALLPGTNRLVLLAVAAEVGGGGTTAARPDVVTYGGTAMTVSHEHSGGTGFWGPDLFFYYLTETGLAGKTGNQTVVINGAPATPNPGAPNLLIANLLQLNGVRQSGPLGPSNGGTLPGSNPNPDVISHSLSVATTGSRIYSLTAGLFCGGSALDAAVTPAGPTVIQVLNIIPSGEMRAAAAYVGNGSANSLAGGPGVSYSPTWTYASCGEITHSAVVILPAP